MDLLACCGSAYGFPPWFRTDNVRYRFQGGGMLMDGGMLMEESAL
jgi:hypothetical protein